MADFFLESWHEGTLLLDQSQPPVCLGPAFTHLIQPDQWPSLKFEGNSTRQLLQSVWFKKTGNLDNSQSQFLEYDVTHLDRNPMWMCCPKKKGFKYGAPNIFDKRWVWFSVDIPGVMELWGLDISIEKPASQMTAAILMFKGPLTVSVWSIGRLEIAAPCISPVWKKKLQQRSFSMDHVFISTLKKRLQNRFDHSIHDWKIGNGGGASRWIGDWHHLSQFSKGLFSSFCMPAGQEKKEAPEVYVFFCFEQKTPNTWWFQSWIKRWCLLPMLHLSTIHSRPGCYFFFRHIRHYHPTVQQELRSCLELETEDRLLKVSLPQIFSPRCLACCPNQEPRGHKPRAGEKARGLLCEWTKSQLWYYGSFVKSFFGWPKTPSPKKCIPIFLYTLFSFRT